MGFATQVSGVFSRAAISTLGMAIQGGARFVYTLAIARVAGPQTLAEVSALLSVAVFASLFWPAPAGTAASRFIPVQSMGEPALLVLKRTFFVSVLFLILAAAAAAVLLGASVAQIIGCAALTVGYSGYVFVRGVLIGEDRIVRATIVDGLTSLAAIAVLVLVLVGDLHWALLLPLAVSYLLFAILSWPRGRGEVTRRTMREVVSFTRDAAIAAVATGGLLPAVSILILAFETPTIAGFIAAGLTLATPANQISQALTQVLIPQFAGQHNRRSPELYAFQLRMFLLSTAGFAVVYALLIGLASWILVLVYGEAYSEGTLAMQIIMVGIFFMSIISSPLAYLTATGRQTINARVWAVTLPVSVAVMLLTGPTYGQWGVLAGFLLGTVGGASAVMIAGLIVPARQARQARRNSSGKSAPF